MTETTDIPVYEIDPKKKYILSIKGTVSVEKRDEINNQIRLWLADDSRPIFLVNGDLVTLVKVEDVDESS